MCLLCNCVALFFVANLPKVRTHRQSQRTLTPPTRLTALSALKAIRQLEASAPAPAPVKGVLCAHPVAVIVVVVTVVIVGFCCRCRCCCWRCQLFRFFANMPQRGTSRRVNGQRALKMTCCHAHCSVQCLPSVVIRLPLLSSAHLPANVSAFFFSLHFFSLSFSLPLFLFVCLLP